MSWRRLLRGVSLSRLRLLPKLLLPFLILTLAIGFAGSFLLVRGLASGAMDDLRGDSRRLLGDAASLFLIQEQYVEDSVYIGANLEGMADAVDRRDAEATADLADSVRVLRSGLNLLVITDASGTGLVEFLGDDIRGSAPRKGDAWVSVPSVREVLNGDDLAGGFLSVGGRHLFVVVRAVRKSESAPIAGVTMAGIRVESFAERVATRLDAGVRIFDDEGRLLAGAGTVPAGRLPVLPERPIVTTERIGTREVLSGYAPLELEKARIGTISVNIPQGPALSAAREAAVRLGLTLLLVMVALGGVGVIIARSILSQVRPLTETNRALAQGDLSARAPVVAADELGELARGFNDMAEKLEESYRDLEKKVEDRTEKLAVANQNLATVNRTLRETYKAQSEFFSSLSHELRTPLFIINGNAELLLDSTGKRASRAAQAETLESIKKAGDYILDVVNEILDFKRLEAGRLQMELVEVDLGSLLHEVSRSTYSLAQLSDLGFTPDIPGSLPVVRGDAAQLKKIFNNLLSNAIKYTKPGGNVRLDVRTGNGAVEISISDTGLGIPKGTGERIFEPFYRVKANAPQRGEPTSGLGLALTKQLVEAHNGSISYTSQIGKGTVFTVALPIARAPIGGGSRRAHRIRNGNAV